MAAVNSRGRMTTLGGIAIALLSLLVVRVWFLQVVNAESMDERAQAIRTRTVRIPPERGRIFDSQGRIVADNERLLTLTVDRETVKDDSVRAELFSRLSGPLELPAEDIEIAFTHSGDYGEEIYSFVNGQHTTQGGTHQQAFREAFVKTIRDFYKKDYEASDIRQSIVAAVSVRVVEPVFESQTKTKLGSSDMGPDGPSIKTAMLDFVKKNVDDYLHKNPTAAEALLKKILQNERERKDMAGVQKLAKERAKRANLHNKKLRDCKTHLTDPKSDVRFETTLFITEGDSASGSITKSRNPNLQAVFSLRGKPLNCYGLKKKIVYENEEFNLLQHALNIEEGLENLRYNRIVIATDADVDGMHIRLLLMTFFLQFFPDLVRNGHLYILGTPLFRVRNKKETIYCYSDEERKNAISKLGHKPEITRFKGLGEISPDEFAGFIGPDIRIEPVILSQESNIEKLLNYYMGKNTPERQEFIIDNLVVEKDDEPEIVKTVLDEAELPA